MSAVKIVCFQSLFFQILIMVMKMQIGQLNAFEPGESGLKNMKQIEEIIRKTINLFECLYIDLAIDICTFH